MDDLIEFENTFYMKDTVGGGMMSYRSAHSTGVYRKMSI